MTKLCLTTTLFGLLVISNAFGASHRDRDGGGQAHLTGEASWYGNAHRGRLTANGERFDPNAMTCAHRSIPLGSTVTVTNLSSGHSVVVRINDHGPYAKGRVIDCSERAARLLNYHDSGTARVRIDLMQDAVELAEAPELPRRSSARAPVRSHRTKRRH